MSDTVLSARGLRKSFPSGDTRLEVLRGVDLDVAAGESVSIRGESGSGKSTLLNLLAGLDAPDSGAVTWAGSGDTGARRRAAYLGMVFQSFYLVPELDAFANVLLARRILGVWTGPRAPARGSSLGASASRNGPTTCRPISRGARGSASRSRGPS